MTEIDLSKVPPKKPKIAVSLSLDKENIEFLKEDIEKNAKEGVTLSAVFDYWLEHFVSEIKKRKEENPVKKEEKNES